MTDSGTFSCLLERLRAGDEGEIRKLWDRYFEPLKQFARHRVDARYRKTHDDEDLALSAINAFQKCLQDGRYAEVDGQNDIWRLLVAITEKKAIDHLRRQHAKKRGEGTMRGESFFVAPNGEQGGISQIEHCVLDHEFAVDFFDQLQCLFQKLDDPDLIRIVRARIEGYTNAEIALQIGKSVSSVERKLRLARDIWREADDQ